MTQTSTAATYTIDAYGTTVIQITKRAVTHAVVMVDYHGDAVVTLSKNERTAANQLARDLASGYAVQGEVRAL